MNSENIIFSLTKEEIQEIAQQDLNRDLTEAELETVTTGLLESHNILELSSIISGLIKSL